MKVSECQDKVASVKRETLQGLEVKCENCDTNTKPAKQSKKNVTPSKKERQVDHKKAKSKGGSGTPNNGQVLCRGCNIKKSDD